MLSLQNDKQLRLVVGLGNPGREYEKTRHNIGFEVVQAFAKKHQMELMPDAKIAKGKVAKGEFEGCPLLLLMPLLYMNQSGASVGGCANYFHIAPKDILVISDDADLPFGEIRLRPKGSSGGHNGLKSVEAHLQSQEYPKLRMGIGRSENENLADYVLAKFSKEELEALSELIEKAIKVIEIWLVEGLERAMNRKKD